MGMLRPHRRDVLGFCTVCGCGAAQIVRYRSGRIFRSDAPSYTLRFPAHDHRVAVIGTSRSPRHSLGHMLRWIGRHGEWNGGYARLYYSVPYRRCCGGNGPGPGGGIRYGRLTGWP